MAASWLFVCVLLLFVVAPVKATSPKAVIDDVKRPPAINARRPPILRIDTPVARISRPRSNSAPALVVSPLLPKECTTATHTRPCLMLWHAGPRDEQRRPRSSVWAALRGQGVGHAAMWLCDSEINRSGDGFNKRCYASWWPKGGTASMGKSDIIGPADPHSYADDLDIVKGEGHAPDVVVALDGWDAACLVKYFEEVVMARPTYMALGRNCVCVVVELLKQCPRKASFRGDVAMRTLQELSTHTQFPKAVSEFIDAYESNRAYCECALDDTTDPDSPSCKIIRSASSGAPRASSGSEDKSPAAPANSPANVPLSPSKSLPVFVAPSPSRARGPLGSSSSSVSSAPRSSSPTEQKKEAWPPRK